MSVEEMVREYQSGNREVLPDLWRQVRGFAVKRAIQKMRSYRLVGTDRAVDVDDLIQEAYFAMVRAAETYDPEKEASFLGWWKFFMRTAFNSALNVRTSKGREAICHRCKSLDTPLDESDGDTLGAMIQSDAGELEEADRRIWRENLRRTMTSMLQELPPQWQSILHKRYFEEKTLQEIAAEAGLSHQCIHQKILKAQKQLAEKDRRGLLREFYEQE